MYHSIGSISSQIEQILKEEFAESIRKYQMVEKGEYWLTYGLGRGTIPEMHRDIDMHTDVNIALHTGYLMKAVFQYKECPQCGGWGSYVGYDCYEWCYHCNCFHEVPA